jgi:hypothetical protein
VLGIMLLLPLARPGVERIPAANRETIRALTVRKAAGAQSFSNRSKVAV